MEVSRSHHLPTDEHCGVADNRFVLESRSKLTNMLLTGYKVEIEAAYDFVSPSEDGLRGLIGYLEHKLC